MQRSRRVVVSVAWAIAWASAVAACGAESGGSNPDASGAATTDGSAGGAEGGDGGTSGRADTGPIGAPGDAAGDEPGDARTSDAEDAQPAGGDSGGLAESGVHDAGVDQGGGVPEASATSCTAGQYEVIAADYFTGVAIPGATATVDGAAATLPCLTLSNGVHPLQVRATGYAVYNGAIQVPGGAMTRTVSLFPVTASMSAWFALVNSDRAANGVAALQGIDSGLTISGWNHVVDMGTKGYFAHFDPNGFAPTTRSLLLGAMMMGAENAAAGDMTYVDAETAFMDEKNSLPNKTASDCAANYDLAGHYCDLVTASHNWIGFGLAKVPGSKWVTYYTEEFGDLYAYYDTTAIGPYPSPSSMAKLTMVPAQGYSFSYEFTETMPTPQPISIATLNADPTCASMCPANDAWYPSGATAVSTKGTLAYAPPLSTSQIVFLELSTNATTFFGASALAAFWAGGTAMVDTYTDATSKGYLVP
jgi:hypothetical protein